MLRKKTLEILDLNKSLDEIALLFPPDLITKIRSSSRGETIIKSDDTDLRRNKEVDEIKNKLIEIANHIDERLHYVLRVNRVNILLRYTWIITIIILLIAAIVLAITGQTTQRLLVSLSGIGISIALVNWPLRQLQNLQDERLLLIMKLKKFEPLIITCLTKECLQDVAVKIYADLSTMRNIDTPSVS